MAKSTKGDAAQPILQNRRASFTYELGERYEAGLMLVGSEVKTLRLSAGDLTDGWVEIQGTNVWLRDMYLPQLAHAAFGHDPRRPRKLLLRASEIERLRKALTGKGMTGVPTRVYWKNGRAKVEIAVARGKHAADKRHSIRERELDRETRAAMARGRKGDDLRLAPGRAPRFARAP